MLYINDKTAVLGIIETNAGERIIAELVFKYFTFIVVDKKICKCQVKVKIENIDGGIKLIIVSTGWSNTICHFNRQIMAEWPRCEIT